jgi:hypothetical protein
VSTDDAALTGAATWQDPGWRDGALAWAVERLAERGRAPSGRPEQVHVRAWSTVIRIRVDDGSDVWLKSVGTGSAQEPVLAEALGGWVPDGVLVPLAVEPDRRLLLLPDGGPTLRETGGGRIPEAWEAMLAGYARLQVELAEHDEDMVALGVPDNRPERLPDLVGDLLADDEALLAGRPDGIEPHLRARLIDGLGAYTGLCRALATGPVPATLQHDDLHDANVFVVGNGHRFFDWGDASVAHPFLSLLVPLRMAIRALDLPQGHPVVLRLRDAYLQPWRGHAEMPVLRELVDLALQVAPLERALTWHRILLGVSSDERAEWQASVPGWAAETAEPGPLAGVPGA